MAGFKKPLYEYLGLNLISYSLYENKLDILGVSINNPISKYGRKLYVFKIILCLFFILNAFQFIIHVDDLKIIITKFIGHSVLYYSVILF
jgi:hypothetical protein